MRKSIVLILCLVFSVSALQAQSSDVDEIKSVRQASNQALRNYDEELNSTFLTEDVLITTGAGTLLSGKAELMDYINNSTGPKMYWVRTPSEIKVNPQTQLAWETGTWEGFYADSSDPVVGGKYSAQWTKKSGIWLIQSQLFVTLGIE